MISRLMTVIGVLSLTWVAQAQVVNNCVKSMSLAPYSSGVNVFHSGSGNCINDANVSYTSMTPIAIDANALHEQLNQKCKAIAYNAGCLPKPPPVSYRYSYTLSRAKYLSAAGEQFVSIQMQSSVLDPVACQSTYTNHSFVLDRANSSNVAFINAFSTYAGRYLNVYLQCTDPVVVNVSGNTTSKIYTGCKIQTYSPTSQSLINCY